MAAVFLHISFSTPKMSPTVPVPVMKLHVDTKTENSLLLVVYLFFGMMLLAISW